MIFGSLTIMMFLVLLMTGCRRDNRPTIIDGEVWSYYRLGRQGRDGIALVSLNCESILTEDGVLNIPNEYSGYQVVLLSGIRGSAGIGWGIRSIPFEARTAKRVVIPEGVAINDFFWSAAMIQRRIEFLAEIPDERNAWFNTHAMIIVPDGASYAYTRFFVEVLGVPLEHFQDRFRFIERSEYLQLVKDGIL